jgi:hypothetical protein
MTPKEKAKELIRRFYSIGAIECKQCALIAVDEILNETDCPYDWQLVKEEIEKL